MFHWRSLNCNRGRKAHEENCREPWPWSLNFGYNQAEVLAGANRHLICAGQTSVDADGSPQHQGDMRNQIALALDSLEAVLNTADMGLAEAVAPLPIASRMLWAVLEKHTESFAYGTVARIHL